MARLLFLACIASSTLAAKDCHDVHVGDQAATQERQEGRARRLLRSGTGFTDAPAGSRRTAYQFTDSGSRRRSVTLQTAVTEWCTAATNGETTVYDDTSSAMTTLQSQYGWGNIQDWDVSLVTSMSQLFNGKAFCNPPIGSWVVSQVTDMQMMFRAAAAFNQDLSSWDVSRVTNMYQIFWGAAAFNQPLNSWVVSQVTDMQMMFRDAAAFNQPLNSWVVSQVTNMYQIFWGAAAFNQPLNSWVVSSVWGMEDVFRDAALFNQDLSSWDMSAVRITYGMFDGAAAFNQPLSSWNMRSVTNMNYMFKGAAAFNQPLNNWVVSNVRYMYAMFQDAVAFNQPLDNWTPDWTSTFGAQSTQLTSLENMFNNAQTFNQDLNCWDVSRVTGWGDWDTNANADFQARTRCYHNSASWPSGSGTCPTCGCSTDANAYNYVAGATQEIECMYEGCSSSICPAATHVLKPDATCLTSNGCTTLVNLDTCCELTTSTTTSTSSSSSGTTTTCHRACPFCQCM